MFLGRSVTQHKQVSDDTAHAIDEEVRRVIEMNYKRARQILETNLDKLHAMADALIKYETHRRRAAQGHHGRRTPKPPDGWDEALSNKPPGRRPRGRRPVARPIPASQH